MAATSIGVKRRDPNCAGHQYLYSAQQNVLACSLKAPACVDLEIVSRAFTEAFEANGWELCKRLLSTQAAESNPARLCIALPLSHRSFMALIHGPWPVWPLAMVHR
jgi:hypothetical protein